MGKWVTDKEATENETGKKHQSCSVCGNTINEETIPMIITFEYKINPDGKTCTVTGIGDFSKNELYIPEYVYEYKVTAIGSKAFEGCTDLTVISLPNTVEAIGNRAFYGCTGITEITIPESVTSIGTQIFYKASNLSTVYYNSPYSDANNQILKLDHITKVVFGGKKIPELMRGLGKGVKSFKEGMKDVEDDVKEIKKDIE